MYLSRLVTLMVLGGVLSAPLAAQGIPRNAQRSTVNMAPRFMVANPFAFAPTDSGAAVAIGSGLREEMKDVVGRDFQVVEQQQMNDALTQYGYPTDAILSPALATTLAKNIQARFIVTSTLAKSQRGGYSLTARVVGVNDDAGNVVTLAQQQGESPQQFGKRLAEALEPLVLPGVQADDTRQSHRAAGTGRNPECCPQIPQIHHPARRHLPSGPFEIRNPESNAASTAG